MRAGDPTSQHACGRGQGKSSNIAAAAAWGEAQPEKDEGQSFPQGQGQRAAVRPAAVAARPPADRIIKDGLSGADNKGKEEGEGHADIQ